MKITVLGSGTSHGIPVVGCGCPVCTSADSRDKRMRASVFIEGQNGETALIDAGQEFRLQAIRAGIKSLDGIFLTHAHADHIHGLDDVRPLCKEKAIPIYGNSETITEMKSCFSYIWKETQPGGGKPKLTPITIDSPALSGPVRIGGLSFSPVPVKHGILDILGWEIQEGESGKSLLYLTDVSVVPPETLKQLNEHRLNPNSPEISRVIIIGALRKSPHETHFCFEQALNTALGLGAKAIYLTHICHDHLHIEIEEYCRDFRYSSGIENNQIEELEIHPAHDGLVITLLIQLYFFGYIIALETTCTDLKGKGSPAQFRLYLNQVWFPGTASMVIRVADLIACNSMFSANIASP